jgi:hypothetical protein
MMNRRLLLFVLGLLLVGAAILYAVSIWLPAQGVTYAGPVLGIRSQLAVPQGGILRPPTDRASLPFFGLRPFGLLREGPPGVLWHLGALVSLLILAVIALFVAPRRVGVLVQVVSNGWGQRLLAFVIGLLGYLGFALLSFLVFINVVGWPLVIVLSLAIYLATAFGLVAIGLALGSGLCRLFRIDDRGPLFRLGVGVVVLFLGSIVPYLGWLVVGCSAVLGFGAVLWTRGGGITGWSLDDSDI